MILVFGPEDDIAPIGLCASSVPLKLIEVSRGKENDRTKHSRPEIQALNQTPCLEVGLSRVLTRTYLTNLG